MVGRPSWKNMRTSGRTESGQKGHPKGPGVVWRPSRRAGSGREALLEGHEDLLKDREWSEGPSQRAGSGREAFPQGRERTRGPPGRPRVVGRAIPKGQVWLECPPGRPGVVRRPSQQVGRTSKSARSGREALPVCRQWSGDPHIKS